MIVNCPKCGTKMESESLGWKCQGCKGFVDLKGDFHEYIERPFMPPMKRIDKIRFMRIDEMVEWAFQNAGCSMCVRNKCGPCVDIEGGCKKYIREWFEEKLTEDEHRT